MPRDMRTYRGYGKRRYSGRVTFLICLIIVLLIAVTAAILIFLRPAPEPQAGPVEGMGYDPAAHIGTLAGENAGDLNALGQFEYRLNRSPVVTKGTANWRIENPPENRQLMRVRILLEDGTPVYETELIKPYYYIASDQLDVKLKAGEYPATAEITVVDSVSHEPLSSASEALTIRVE